MGIGYGSSIVKDGLVLYLDAANPKSYPGTGTVWYDLSGNGNNANLVGTATYAQFVSGTDGKYFAHDPGDAYFGAPDSSTVASTTYGAYWNIPTDASLNPEAYNGWTVSGFMRVNGAQSGNGGAWFVMDDADLRIHLEPISTPSFRANGADGWSQVNGSIETYVFHHYTFVFTQTSGVYGTDPGQIQYYRDGVLLTTDTSFTPTATTDYQISLGRRRGHLHHFLRADLANYQYYNRPLTADEIAHNYIAGRGRFGL